MKKIFTVILLTAFISTLYSQVNSISGSGTNRMNSVIKYSLIRDAPEYANDLIISLFFPYLNYSKSTRNLGVSGGLNYNLKNIVAMNFNFQKALIDFNRNIPDADIYDIRPAGNRSSMTHFDLTFDFSFIRHFSDKKKLLWGGWLNFKQMYRFAIRAGYQYYSNPFYLDDYACNAYDIADPKHTEKALINGQNYQFMSYSHILSLGFSAKRNSNFIIQIEGADKKNSYRRLSEAYIDILFLPYISFGDVSRIDSIVDGTGIQIIHTYKVTSGDCLKWGFRAGYMHYPLSLAGFCWGLEAGILPGPTAGIFKNTYILVKVGVGFSANLFNRP